MKRRGCWAKPRTPASPTTPIAKPAAKLLKPQASPPPKCIEPKKRGYLSATKDPDMTTLTMIPYNPIIPAITTGKMAFVKISGRITQTLTTEIPVLAVA